MTREIYGTLYSLLSLVCLAGQCQVEESAFQRCRQTASHR